jgi:hypothetical protein
MDLLDREIEPVVVPFGVAAELAAAVSQRAQELDADIAELFDEFQQSNFCTNDFFVLSSLAHQDQEPADERHL